METPVQFQSGAETLSGILHLPEDYRYRRPDIGFVFVHSGSRGRRGNTFQYPIYSRYFADFGFPSLRFDPAGIGDSTGEIETCQVDDFYGSIQLGRFVDDTVAGVEEFYRHVNPRRLVLFGICGGAITALLAAPKLKQHQVDGLVLISIPVLIDSSEQSELDRIPKEYARKYLAAMYARKLLSFAAWRRLLTRKSEVGTIWTMLKATLLGAGERSSSKPEQDGRGTRFNRLFTEALDAMVAQKSRVIFLFGDDDTFRWEFEREFYNNYWQHNPGYARQCVVHYLPGCNHMFTMREWQKQALDLVSPWLQKL